METGTRAPEPVPVSRRARKEVRREWGLSEILQVLSLTLFEKTPDIQALSEHTTTLSEHTTTKETRRSVEFKRDS